jgi:hypothetical protein
MDMLDSFLVASALIVGVALLGWLLSRPEWRRLKRPGELEMWRFASRRGSAQIDRWDMSRAAEIRCAFCPAATECQRRLAAGEDLPVAHCPNVRNTLARV